MEVKRFCIRCCHRHSHSSKYDHVDDVNHKAAKETKSRYYHSISVDYKKGLPTNNKTVYNNGLIK